MTYAGQQEQMEDINTVLDLLLTSELKFLTAALEAMAASVLT